MQRVKAVSALYEQNRFLDAWAVTKSVYQDKNALAALDAETLVLFGRLAHRLGSAAGARLLFHRAKVKGPDQPSVRYFARRDRHRGTLLEQITAALRAVEYFRGHDEYQAALEVELAFDYASVQDFENAKLWMSRALKLAPEDSFVRAFHSRVLQTIGDREGALLEAEAAWALSPGKPSAASAIASSLSALGRAGEAAERLSAFVKDTPQSYEVAQTAIASAILDATRKGEAAMRDTAKRALASIPELEILAPLRDRSTRRVLAAMGMEAARQARDLEAAKKFARAINSPFHDRILANIEANPGGARIVLPHKFSRQGIAECVPASLSTCLGAFGIELDHQRLAEKLTFGGTALWRARAWAEENNYLTRAFIADAEISVKLIDAGLPFIITIPGLDESHACAVIGVDHATGTLLIHDPNHAGVAEMNIEMLGGSDAPFGPQALLVVPRSAAARLETFRFPYAVEEDAWGALERAMAQRADAAAIREELEKLRRAGGAAAHLELFEARVAAYRGETARALELVDRLGAQFPKSISLEVFRLQLVRALGNTVRLREVLAKLVESDTFEEATDHPGWFRGHPALRVEYAEILESSAQNRELADRQLSHALLAAPLLARAYEVYGRSRLERGQIEASLLPLRIACTLQPSDDSAARNYVQALLAATREEEAIAWLEKRVARFAGNENAAPTWIALIDLHALLGREDRAHEQLCEARAQLPKSPAIAVRAVSLLAERGDFAAAHQALEELRGTRFYYGASITLARIEKRDAAAKAQAEAWVAAEPGSLPAKKALLDLVSVIDGAPAAVRLAEAWLAGRDEQREAYEQFALEVLAQTGARARRVELLEQRIARNPLDAWAHRELALQCLHDLRSVPPAKRAAAREQLERALAECERSCPDHPLTLGLRGDLATIEKDHDRAYAAFRQAMELDSGAGRWMVLYAESAKRIGKSHALVIAAIDKALASVPGSKKIFSSALAAVASIGDFRDVQAFSAKWRKSAPHDVEIAVVDVLNRLDDLVLEGDAALEREASELERLAARHPAHGGLRYALGSMALARGDLPAAIEHREKALALSFGDELQLFRLSLSAYRVPELDRALDSEQTALWWTTYLNERYRFDEAVALVTKIAARYPDSVAVCERYALHLSSEGDTFEADRILNTFFERTADRAESVRLHARYLASLKLEHDTAEEEALLRRALDLDSPDLQAFSELHSLYETTGQDEKRLALLDEYAPTFETPAPIVLRRAAYALRVGALEEARELVDAHLLRHPDDLGARSFWISTLTEELDARTLLDHFDRFVLRSSAHARVAANLLTAAAAKSGVRERIDRGWAKLRVPGLRSYDLELVYLQDLIASGRAKEALPIAERLEKRSLEHRPELTATVIVARLHSDLIDEARAAMKALLGSPLDSAEAIAVALHAFADSRFGLDPIIRDLSASIAAGAPPRLSAFESVVQVLGRRRAIQAGRALAEAIILTGRRELWRGMLPQLIEMLLDSGASMFAVELFRVPEVAQSRASLRVLHARALLDSGHAPEAMKVVENWQAAKYPSVSEAWTHVRCCQHFGDLEAVLTGCRAALELRPVCRETNAFVQRLFLSSIELEQRPGKGELGAKLFLEDWEKYGRLLAPPRKKDDLATMIPLLFARLLQATTPEDIKAADREVLDFLSAHDCEWARPAFKKWVAPKLPWWKRFLRALGF